MILLFSLRCLCQTEETVAIYQEGDKAFQNQDFEKAKNIYSNLTKIDSLNNKPWFNLGVVELTIGNIEAGCGCIKRAHSLLHKETEKILSDYCSDYYVFFDQLEIKPKFKYQKKEYPLFISKNELNPKFLKIFQSKIKSSKQLETALNKGPIFLKIKMTTIGLQSEVKRMAGSQAEIQSTNRVISEIFGDFEFIPGRFRDRVVEILESWMFPIKQEMALQQIRDFVPYRNGD